MFEQLNNNMIDEQTVALLETIANGNYYLVITTIIII